MDKRDAITSLHAIVHTRLLGEGAWLADRDVCASLNARLTELGLQTETADGTSTPTALGKAVHVNLFMAFIGLLYEWDIPMLLEDFGLLDEDEVDAFYEGLEDDDDVDPEHVLRPLVQKAFFKYFNPSERVI